MRVLFDAYWWDDGPIANRTVQRELILAWARAHPDDELVLALRRDAVGDGIPEGATVVRTRLWPHALANRFELPRLQRRARADVAIVHNYAPRSGASAVFIHDVMFVDHPEWFSAAERVYFRPMLPWARSARVVATSTRTEAERIARLGRRIAVPVDIGLGVPPVLSARANRPEGLPDVDGFALTVGRLNVRKNLGRILSAAAVATRIDVRHPLVVVGGTAHSGVGAELPDDARPAIEDGRIVLLGGVADDELAWLYANASLAVTLSRDEGFGLPAIEAAQFDTPLVASDIPVFRETVGGYATLVSPDAPPAEIAAAIDAADGTSADGSAIRDRWTWDRAVTALRDAIASRTAAR